MRRLVPLALAAVVAAGMALAQDREEDAKSAEQARDPRPEIRVLHDPYELASFYRNENEGGFFATASERHPIASFYRGGMSRGGYSRFWSSGYNAQGYQATPALDYRSRIGENGDLFLLAPTFLAPVGPLADVFFSVDR